MTATLRPQGAPAPVTATEPTCAATPGCQRYPAPGLLTCLGHLERLGAILRDIEEESALLDATPSMAQRMDAGGVSLASERTPARLDVLILRDRRSFPYNRPDPGPACLTCRHQLCTAIRAWENAVNARATNGTSILETLHGWARIVREERDLTPPEQVTIVSERDLLTRQLEWLAAQPFIDEAYRDFDQLLKLLRATNATSEARRKAVGLCPTLFDDGECGGRLWPSSEDGEVICELCGRTFGPAELRHLGDMLLSQGYIEVFRASWYTGVATGTIRRWVSEGRCTSDKDGKKLMVQVAEIEQLRDRNKRRGVAS